ncbi:hypothetical protein STXM2123_1114 [Streptomyces sp. F-3]|nr:hypothetical protein STXM2123_1114 [Streptomyces sp. F-3]
MSGAFAMAEVPSPAPRPSMIRRCSPRGPPSRPGRVPDFGRARG